MIGKEACMKKFFGAVTPLVTPMDKSGAVDYDSLESLCLYLVEKGINGVYPNGTTGEMAYLTTDERKRILERVVKAVAGRTVVFSQVGAATTEESVELARHAEAAGADGIGVVTPYFHKLDDEQLLRHYKAVAESVSADFPIYLYAIPQLAANDITVDLARRIADACPNVIGIKYSYPDMPRMLKFLKIRDGKFSVVAGPDDLFYCLLASGGDGTISGNSNVIPEQYAAVYAAFLAGDWKKAAKLQDRVIALNAAISGPNNIACYKSGLVYRGVIAENTLRRPLTALTPEEESALFARMEELDYAKTC